MSRRPDSTTRAVLALAAVALLARLVGLGQRTAHWDEGRVAYWVLRAAETGDWAYRPIIHGPFLQHVDRYLFALAGTSDFVLRLPVAVLGGLLPVAALLYRTRLRDDETVALAAVLALDPLLVYFSRFYRSDVVLAAFALVALGCLLRALDTDRRGWLGTGVLSLALGFTAKENALLYLLCWAGAATLVLAWRVVGTPAPRDRLSALAGRLLGGARSRGVELLAGLAAAVGVVAVFYAPRGTGEGPLDLFVAGTLGAAEKYVDLWLLGGLHEHAYAPFLAHYAGTLALASGAVCLLAVVGGWVAWRDGRSSHDARDAGGASLAHANGGAATGRAILVAFCLLWGLASVTGYPYAADIMAPWLAVHAVAAFAVPAAVGLASVARRVRAARASGDGSFLAGDGRRRARVAVVVVVALCVVQVAGANAALSYTGVSQTDFVAQGAQPTGEFGVLRNDLPAIAAANEGPDVAFYGRFAVANESRNADPPAESNWYDRLPLPWYTERANARVVSARSPADLRDPPPVVVADSERRAELEPHLEGYVAREHALLLHGENTTYSVLGYSYHVSGESVVVFVERDALERARSRPASLHSTGSGGPVHADD